MRKPPSHFAPLADAQHPFLATVANVTLDDVAEIERRSLASKRQRDIDSAKRDREVRDLMRKRKAARGKASVTSPLAAAVKRAATATFDATRAHHDRIVKQNKVDRAAERERRASNPDLAMTFLLRKRHSGTPLAPSTILRSTTTSFARMSADSILASLQAFDAAGDTDARDSLMDRVLDERAELLS